MELFYFIVFIDMVQFFGDLELELVEIFWSFIVFFFNNTIFFFGEVLCNLL